MSALATIADAVIGKPATIVAQVHEVKLKHPKPKFDLVEVTLVDGTSTLIATFFRQAWLAKTLAPGTRVSVAGVVEFNYGFKRMTMPFLGPPRRGRLGRFRAYRCPCTPLPRSFLRARFAV